MKLLITLLISLALTGCNRYSTLINAEVDALAIPPPSKLDPVALEIPEGASISERNMVARVKEEMIDSGFKYTDNNPTYKIITKLAEQDVQTGTTVDPWVPGRVNTNYVGVVTLTLTAYKAADPKKTPVWTGSSGNRFAVFQVLRHSAIKTLLESFGKTFSGFVYMDKAYKENK